MQKNKYGYYSPSVYLNYIKTYRKRMAKMRKALKEHEGKIARWQNQVNDLAKIRSLLPIIRAVNEFTDVELRGAKLTQQREERLKCARLIYYRYASRRGYTFYQISKSIGMAENNGIFSGRVQVMKAINSDPGRKQLWEQFNAWAKNKFGS